MTDEQVKDLFTYHAPKSEQKFRYENLRAKAKVLALEIQDLCPESREKALAITNLQQSIMWANASIAINT